MTTQTRFNTELVNYAINQLDNVSDGIYAADLHSKLFNEDYFIIGYYDAEQWLIKNVGIFQAIEEIKQYENDNFGEVNTDFSSSEKVVNMYAYIKGEEILNSCKTISDNLNERLSAEQLAQIKSELEELL
jgi:hypothetical protein